jgi:5-methyltetrahydrofolate--homocysteine methyltransferase
MQRQGFTIPLLIGGATTSRAHTSVKIDPAYEGPVVWVKDASRSVPVAQNLVSDDARVGFLAELGADYERLLIEKGEKSTFQKTKVVAKASSDDFAKSFR